MKSYDHRKIEAKWRKKWAKDKLYKTPDKIKGKDNFYNLVEFAYPSGNLHIGHWYAFAVPDIFARYKRMQGFNVLFPNGADSFGLPAENAAIKRKLDPKDWTYENIASMKKQFESIGAMFDWSREIHTSDPEYYKWTQFIFTKFFEKDLAYKKEQTVNWCLSCKTVLANEQVVGGLCERCDSRVEQKEMPQWVLKITEYAEKLLEDLDPLDWPEEIKQQQRNWIGKSEGAEISFQISGSNFQEETRSYVMGIDSGIEKDLERIGVKVHEKTKDGDYKISIPKDKIKSYEELISEKLKPGFWNEYVGEETVFIFKDKNGEVERIVWNEADESDLLKLCSNYAKTNFKSIGSMLEGNSWYQVKSKSKISVFTTRPDTLFGATYLVVSPEHEIISGLKSEISNIKEVEGYVKEAKAKSEIERTSEGKNKTGVELKGIKVTNPANGEEVPVWVADYVLGKYGTGAIMAVPAHDERDFEFAKKYNLPITQVVAPYFTANIESKDAVRTDKKTVTRKTVYALLYDKTKDSFLCLDWEKFNWHSGIIGGVDDGETFEEAAKREIVEETGYTDVKFVKNLGATQHNHFFAAHKDENRYAIGQGVLFEIITNTREEVRAEHTTNHKTVWIKSRDMEDWLNLSAFNYIWQSYKNDTSCFTGEGKLINSGEFNNQSSKEAREKITKAVGGKMKTTYKLRDWSVGRQRYWGCPIPVVYDPEGKPHVVPTKHLPWKLPEDVDFTPTGVAPLAKSKELQKRTEKIFGKGWTPEVDTLDTFVDSSWYFLRYLDPKNKKEISSVEKQKLWMPVSQYFGGAEHTTLHLLYSRFFQKVLFDLGLVTEKEPYQKRVNRGLIMGPDGQKMSKSRGNVIDPDKIVENVGADSVRMYLAFIGPYAETGSYPWDMGGIVGIRRFLERLLALSQKVLLPAPSKARQAGKKDNEKLEQILHKTIEKVTIDIEAFKFNTAISALMIFVNTAERGEIGEKQYKIILRLLAPFAPHLAEEIWQEMGEKKSIHKSEWPKYDKSKLVSREVTIAVQVNGKTRGLLSIDRAISEKEVVEKAKELLSVKKWLNNKVVLKVIYIPGKIINIVIN